MPKIVINRCYGGFSVSKAVYQELGLKWDGYGYLDNDLMGYQDPRDFYDYREDPKLVAIVEKLDPAASGDLANLGVVTVPDDMDWTIDDYDGIETVYERHRVWS